MMTTFPDQESRRLGRPQGPQGWLQVLTWVVTASSGLGIGIIFLNIAGAQCWCLLGPSAVGLQMLPLYWNRLPTPAFAGGAYAPADPGTQTGDAEPR